MRLVFALLIALVGQLVSEVAGAEGSGKLAQQVYDFHPLTPNLADGIEAKWAAKDILDERIVDGMESLDALEKQGQSRHGRSARR